MPGYLQMIGSASPSSRVGLWSINGLYAITSRKSDYFWGELQFNNSSGPLYPIITNLAILDNGSNPDISSSSTRTNFIAMTPESFVHDLDGNLTSDGRWNYTWDAENRLIKIESLGSAPAGSKRRLEFAYDCQGRRIWVRITNLDSNQVLSENKFLYDLWNVSAELNATNNGIIRSYVWGSDMSGSFQGAGGVGGLLKLTYNATQTTNSFVASDGNGNVSGLVDAADGTVIAQYEYGPFGEVTRATGPMGKQNPLRFSTKYQDDETGMDYYGYRYYSPSIGRWTSRDLLYEKGGLNLLNFINNEPITRYDYLGLAAGCCAPPKSCEEVCKMALRDNNIAWLIGGGGVVCYCGKACPCVGPAPNLGYKPGDCPFIDLVLMAHEKRHLPNVDCSKCGFYAAEDFKSGIDPVQEECKQRKQSISELNTLRPYLDPKCRGVADKILELLIEKTQGCK